MSTQITKEYIRAPKTGRAKDDYKVLIVGASLAAFILIAQFTVGYLSEQRWFRDITFQTPFYNVTVNSVVLDADTNTVTLSGWMSKRRCEFRSLTGYVTDSNNERHRVYVNTTPEDILTGITGNRPPSKQVERWGPWEITFSVEGYDAVNWEVWAHHRCPNFATVQSNLFASGKWLSSIGE